MDTPEIPDPAFLDTPFMTVNGRTVTFRNYIRALERQSVKMTEGQSTTTIRLGLDQLIGNQVVLAEAETEQVLPTHIEVDAYYDLKKRLLEAQYPGKRFETEIVEQGSTEEEIRMELLIQLAETNLYAHRLKVSEAEIQKAYHGFQGQYFPDRVSLRVIMVSPESPDYYEAVRLLQAGKPFAEVARNVNLPDLKGTGGRTSPTPESYDKVPNSLREQIRKIEPGNTLGPVDLMMGSDAPPMKVWVFVEAKYPPVIATYEECRPDLLHHVVQQKLLDPGNATVRTEVLRRKRESQCVFYAPRAEAVWRGIIEAADDAGILDGD